MGVVNGQPVSAEVTNPAFLDANQDDQAFGKIDFQNTDAASGPTFTNIQRQVNDRINDEKLFLTISGNAKVTWSKPALSFPADIVLISKDWGVSHTISQSYSPININDGQSVYVTIDRQNGTVCVPTVNTTIPKGGEYYRLVTRVGDDLIWHDNSLMRDGLTGTPGEIGSIVFTGVREIPSGTIDGSNTVFNLSETPADSDSLLLFIDSILVPVTAYSLSIGTITFTSGEQPQLGQSLQAFYVKSSAAGGGGGGGGTWIVEYKTLSGTDITNKYVTLANTPLSGAATLVDQVGGTSQQYSVDFTVSTNLVGWNGLALDGYLIAGDILRIGYVY